MPPCIVAGFTHITSARRVRECDSTSKDQNIPYPIARARTRLDVPSNCITTLRCCVPVLKRSGITVELTRRRESKHHPQHQASCETRSRRSRPTICWVFADGQKHSFYQFDPKPRRNRRPG